MDLRKIKDDDVYAVTLLQPVQRGHRVHRPRGHLQFKGSVIKEIAETHGKEVFGDVQSARA